MHAQIDENLSAKLVEVDKLQLDNFNKRDMGFQIHINQKIVKG